MLTAKQLITITDSMVAQYVAVVGSKETGHGFGDSSLPIEQDWGLSLELRKLQEFTLHSHDWGLIRSIGDGLHALIIQASGQHAIRQLLKRFMRNLESATNATGLKGVHNFGTLVEYYNAGEGGPYSALLSPAFADLVNILYPGQTFQPMCVYAPTAVLATERVNAPFTPVSQVNINKYAGAGAAIAKVSDVRWIAPDTPDDPAVRKLHKMTIVGYGRTVGGQSLAGRKWTGELMVISGTTILKPEVEGDLLVSVTEIRLPKSWTAGTVAICAAPPEGR